MKTPQQSTHTPTPWELHQDEDLRSWFIWAKGNMAANIPRRTDGVDKANAEFIIRAVNAYEPNKQEISRLFELANERGEKLKVLLEAAKRIVCKNGKDRDIGSETFADRQALVKAIAQAEGENV